MRTIHTLGAIALVMGSAACAQSTPAPAGTLGTVQPTANSAPTCPLGMAGARVALADPADGVDVTFETEGDVRELRVRVTEQADMHGPGKHAGLGHGGVHEGAHSHGLRLSEIDVPVKATASDVAGGAKVHIVPDKAADLATVRSEVHERVAKIVALGACPE